MDGDRPWKVEKTPGVPFYMSETDLAFTKRRWLDLAYASASAAQRLDIFLPETEEGPFPIIVHIHGGGFSGGHRRSYHTLACFRWLERGYAVVAVDYRLSGEAPFPAGLRDVGAAIRWLRANASRYMLDAERVGVFGESSGGNYAAMVCTAARSTLFDDPDMADLSYPCEVQAVIDWYGPTDLSKMDKHLEESGLGPGDHGRADSMESQYLGAPPGEVPDRVRAANPITYIGESMCPILIQHGIADPVVPFQQSVEFAMAIEGRVGSDRYELDLLEGATHDDPAFFTDENFERMLRFFDRCLERPSG